MTATKKDGGGVEAASDFDRAFRYAVVEFIALALVVYYKPAR